MTRLGPPIAHQLSPIAGKNMELFESFWNPSLGRRNLLIHYVFLKTFPDRPAVEGVYISKFQFQVFCCSRDKMLIKRGCKCWSRERKLAKFARLPTTEACLQDLQSMVWFNQFLVLRWVKRRNWAKKSERATAERGTAYFRKILRSSIYPSKVCEYLEPKTCHQFTAQPA